LTVLNEWTFTLVAGYNQLFLSQPVTFNKGNLIQLTQTTAKLALSSSGATYSDLLWNTNMWSPLNSSSNLRFYLNMTYNISQGYYQSPLNINHVYSSVGLYDFILSMGNNIVYQGVANITDCKFKIDIDR
jgi:hypothetical protein